MINFAPNSLVDFFENQLVAEQLEIESSEDSFVVRFVNNQLYYEFRIMCLDSIVLANSNRLEFDSSLPNFEFSIRCRYIAVTASGYPPISGRIRNMLAFYEHSLRDPYPLLYLMPRSGDGIYLSCNAVGSGVGKSKGSGLN